MAAKNRKTGRQDRNCTFIADEEIRAEMVGYVYDVTYGIVPTRSIHWFWSTIASSGYHLTQWYTAETLEDLNQNESSLFHCPEIPGSQLLWNRYVWMGECIGIQALVNLLKTRWQRNISRIHIYPMQVSGKASEKKLKRGQKHCIKNILLIRSLLKSVAS